MRKKINKVTKSQNMFSFAKKIIPGGNMLLSKNPDRFLPKGWPVYFQKTKGCEVWDLDNHKYIDMCIMGIGTNTLGYGNQQVDRAVFDVIEKGNNLFINPNIKVPQHCWYHFLQRFGFNFDQIKYALAAEVID